MCFPAYSMLVISYATCLVESSLALKRMGGKEKECNEGFSSYREGEGRVLNAEDEMRFVA